MATKSYEVVLFPDKSSKATFFRVQSQGLCKGFTSSFLFLTVVELAEFLFVSLSNDCSQDLLKKQILDEENIFIHWMEVVSSFPPTGVNRLQTVAHALRVGYENRFYWHDGGYLPQEVTKDYFESVIEEVNKINNIWITKEYAIDELISCSNSINVSISSVKLYGFSTLPPLLKSLLNAISSPYKELQFNNQFEFYERRTSMFEQKMLLRTTSYDRRRLDNDSTGRTMSVHSKRELSILLLEFRALTLYLNVLKVGSKASPVQKIISIISSPLIPGFDEETKLRLEYCQYIKNLGISKISLNDITKSVRCPQILSVVLSIFLSENNNHGSQHFLYEWMTIFSKSISLLFTGCLNTAVPEVVPKYTDIFTNICCRLGKHRFKVRQTSREKALEFLEAHALDEMKRIAPEASMDNQDLQHMNLPIKPEMGDSFDASCYDSSAQFSKKDLFLFLVKRTVNLFWKTHRIQKELFRFTIGELQTELNIYLAKQIQSLINDEAISILVENELSSTVIKCCIDLLSQDMLRKPFMVEWVNLESFSCRPVPSTERVHERLDVEREKGAYTKKICVKYDLLDGYTPDMENLEAVNVSYQLSNREPILKEVN